MISLSSIVDTPRWSKIWISKQILSLYSNYPPGNGSSISHQTVKLENHHLQNCRQKVGDIYIYIMLVPRRVSCCNFIFFQSTKLSIPSLGHSPSPSVFGGASESKMFYQGSHLFCDAKAMNQDLSKSFQIQNTGISMWKVRMLIYFWLVYSSHQLVIRI